MKLLALFALVVASGAQEWTPSPELGFDVLGYPHTIQVHENYWFSWQLQPLKLGQPKQEQRIRVALAANTEAWIGFGITETGGMKGADIAVIRSLTPGGPFQVFDMHSVDYVPPVLDETQDWDLIYTNQANGETMHILERTADMCHPEHHDMAIVNLEQRFIFSFGDTQDFRYHGANQRTTYFVNLFDDNPPLAPPDLPHFEIHMPGHEVPNTVDSFMCSNMTFPIDTSRHWHIVVIEPLMDNPFAHHIISYGCQNEVVIPRPAGPEGSWNCPTMALPGCSMYSLGWSVGQRTRFLPDHIGIPMGLDSVKHVVLQMHSNNIFSETGVRDFSGYRLYYTDQLRPYTNAGITTGLGANRFAISLPPQQPLIPFESECPGECTSMASGPLQVWSINWHMHQTGHSVHLSHVRNGVELHSFGLHTWDYNWQGNHQIEEFTLLPGDSLYTYCNFQTMDRTEPTYGGEGTQDEMCFVWISAYGADAIGFCTSRNMYPNDPFMNISCRGQSVTVVPEPFVKLPVCSQLST